MNDIQTHLSIMLGIDCIPMMIRIQSPGSGKGQTTLSPPDDYLLRDHRFRRLRALRSRGSQHCGAVWTIGARDVMVVVMSCKIRAKIGVFNFLLHWYVICSFGIYVCVSSGSRLLDDGSFHGDASLSTMQPHNFAHIIWANLWLVGEGVMFISFQWGNRCLNLRLAM